MNPVTNAQNHASLIKIESSWLKNMAIENIVNLRVAKQVLTKIWVLFWQISILNTYIREIN